MILQEATVMRIALLFDSALRPETTGVYCRRALGEIAEVEHYTVDELATIDPRAGGVAVLGVTQPQSTLDIFHQNYRERIVPVPRISFASTRLAGTGVHHNAFSRTV